MTYKQRNYAVSNDGKYLYITLLKDGKTYYTVYSEGIEHIMKSGIFTGGTTNKKDGYLKFTYITRLRQKEIKTLRCYCYTPESLNNLYEYLKAEKWQIRANREGVEADTNTYHIVGKYPYVPRITSKYHDRDIQIQLLDLSNGGNKSRVLS